MVWTVAYMVLDFCPLHLAQLKAACTLSLQNTCLQASSGSHMSLKKKNSLKLNFLSFQPHLLIFKGFFNIQEQLQLGKGRLSSLGAETGPGSPDAEHASPMGLGKGGNGLLKPLNISLPGSWKSLGIEFELHT